MFSLRRIGFKDFIYILLKEGRLRRLFYIFFSIYFPIHLLLTGMIFLDSTVAGSYPKVILLLNGPIGQVPWLIAIIPPLVISISLEAGLSAIIISTLLALNLVGVYYIWKYAKCENCSTNAAVSGISILPALFAVFSCCGGGVLIMLLMSLGFGSLFATVFYPYSRLLVGASAILLTSNLYFIYRRDVNK